MLETTCEIKSQFPSRQRLDQLPSLGSFLLRRILSSGYCVLLLRLPLLRGEPCSHPYAYKHTHRTQQRMEVVLTWPHEHHKNRFPQQALCHFRGRSLLLAVRTEQIPSC